MSGPPVRAGRGADAQPPVPSATVIDCVLDQRPCLVHSAVTETWEVPSSIRAWNARNTWPLAGVKWKTPLDGMGSRFFFNATPTTEFYTLSLHDALPI